MDKLLVSKSTAVLDRRKTSDPMLEQKFLYVNDDGHLTEFLVMTTDAWEDMGSPEQITVTIEPGDLLNVGEDE